MLLLLAACGRTGMEDPTGDTPDPTVTPGPTSTPGALDPAFGTQGIVVHTVGDSVRVRANAIVAGGRILVAGTASSDWLVVRFDASGALDATFADSGALRVTPSDTNGLSGFAALADGRFLLAGSSRSDGSARVHVRRYFADGSEDTSFVIERDWDRASPSDAAISIAPAPGGDVFFVRPQRENGANNRTRFFVERVDASGVLVSAWGGDGVVQIDVDQNDSAWPVALAVDASGRVVLVGTIARDGQHDVLVARFLADGSLDSSWGSGGVVELGGAADDRASAFAAHEDGRLTLAGSTDPTSLLCARLSASGALDGAFGTAGRATIAGNASDDGVYAALAQPSGALLIAGAHEGKFTFARVQADGSSDAGFAFTLASPSPSAARAIAPSPSGAFIFAGDSGEAILLAKWR